MEYHRQCKLVKENMTTVSWIPEKLAIMGNFLKLKDNGVWVDKWKIVSVNTKLETKYVIDRSQEF